MSPQKPKPNPAVTITIISVIGTVLVALITTSPQWLALVRTTSTSPAFTAPPPSVSPPTLPPTLMPTASPTSSQPTFESTAFYEDFEDKVANSFDPDTRMVWNIVND